MGGFVAEVTAYRVSVGRQTSVSYVRTLQLDLVRADDLPYRQIVVYFYEPDPMAFGAQHPEEGAVIVRLPMRDFDAMYHVVQTERPVSAGWVADDDNRLSWFYLGTHAEPPGEGSQDRSRR